MRQQSNATAMTSVAPPTGQGLIDQRRLVAEFNYTVYTDGVLSNSISISPPQNLGGGGG